MYELYMISQKRFGVKYVRDRIVLCLKSCSLLTYTKILNLHSNTSTPNILPPLTVHQLVYTQAVLGTNSLLVTSYCN